MNAREKKLFGDLVRNAAPTRVVLTKTDDSKKMQSHQAKGLSGEIFEEVEYYQPYGFTSRPPVGSEAVALAVGGDRSHLVILAASDRGVRKKEMEEGEVGIYHQNGDFMHFKDGNKVETQTKETTTNAEDKAVTNTKEFEANASQTAKMEAGQTATVAGGSQAELSAPQVGIAGNLTVTGEGGGAGVSIFLGDLKILGDLVVTGTITAGGNIESTEGDVIAGGVSLRDHLHGGVIKGGDKTEPPAGA